MTSNGNVVHIDSRRSGGGGSPSRKISSGGGGKGGASTIDGGGNGPHDPDMEARVAKLEESIQGIDKALREIVPTIKDIAVEIPKIRRDLEELPKIRVDLAELKGRMTGVEGQLRQVPSLWSMGGTMLAINAGIVAVAALIITLAKRLP